MKLRYILFPFAIALISIIPFIGNCSQITKPVANGVTLTQIHLNDAAHPLLINVLTVDFSRPELTFRPVLGRGVVYTDDQYIGKENVGSMVERTGAIAGVNSDFFCMEWGGDPMGVCIIDGELVSEPDGLACVAFTKSKKVVFDKPSFRASLTLPDGKKTKLAGINRPLYAGETVAYTSAFGPKIKNDVPVPYVHCKASNLPIRVGKEVKLTVIDINTASKDAVVEPGTVVLSGGDAFSAVVKQSIKVGDKLSIRFDIDSTAGFDWKKAWQATGGGPYLLRNGLEAVDLIAEGLYRDLDGKYSRTAVGVTKDNKVLLITVDDNQDISKGITLYDFATMLRKMGVVDAINLDGGGSSDMSVRGAVINCPSDGEERQVANGLLLFSKKSTKPNNNEYHVEGISDTIKVGETVKLSLVKGSSTNPVRNLSKIIWGSTSSTGFVDQTGSYTAENPGKGAICAIYGGQLITKPIEIIGKP